MMRKVSEYSWSQFLFKIFLKLGSLNELGERLCCVCLAAALTSSAALAQGISTMFGSDIAINAFEAVKDCDDSKSVRKAQFEIVYTNGSIAPNAKVTLRYGWERLWQDGTLKDWQNIEETVFEPVAFGKWSGSIKKDLESVDGETPSFALQALDFVFKIELPEGASFYDKGNNSRMGFFKGSWPEPSHPCAAVPTFWPLQVNVSSFYRD